MRQRPALSATILALCDAAFVFRAAEYGTFLVWHTWWGSDYRVAVMGITAISAGLKFLYRVLFERRGRLRMAPAAASYCTLYIRRANK